MIDAARLLTRDMENFATFKGKAAFWRTFHAYEKRSLGQNASNSRSKQRGAIDRVACNALLTIGNVSRLFVR